MTLPTPTVIDSLAPAAPGYVTCAACGRIVGYRGRLGSALALHVYADPLDGPRPAMCERRVVAVMLDGDVRCACGHQQEWHIPRAWE